MVKIKLFGIFCLIFIVLVISTGDERTLHFNGISIGYVTADSTGILDMGTRSGEFYDENMAVRIYLYKSECEMMDMLLDGKIDVAFLEDESILFDNKMTDIKIILVFRTKSNRTIDICVTAEKLEKDIALLFRFAEAIDAGCLENHAAVLLRPDEWLKDNPTKTMFVYFVPDFYLEAFDTETDE